MPFIRDGRVKDLPSMTQALAMRLRLDQTTAQEQEEQEYLSEVIELDRDPEDRRPARRRS